jgi:ribosomal subunit interface protein
MQNPVIITFHQMEGSNSFRLAIEKKVQALERFFDRITSVRVTVGMLENQHQKGNLFSVKVDITIPGKNIVVSREPSLHHAHEDPYVALRDAFRAARRQLEDHIRTHFKSRKRHHEEPLKGVVVRFLLDNDGGFLKNSDGREIYFHKQSVLDRGFEKLSLGDQVRYVEEMGENGPQASSVVKSGKDRRRLNVPKANG